MTVVVRCLNCQAVYETDASAAAVREVNRCQECGQRSLVVAEEEELAAEDEQAGEW
jgi:DNA-directed RNA polymerase subunit RPC12/RpoP